MNKTSFYFSILTISFVLSALAAPSISEATIHSEKIILGSGCFWGAEKGYESLPGVIDAVSGYADGDGVQPTYREITKLKHKFNPNNHAEVVEVTYNTNIISTADLLMHYFESHDPTQLNRQGNDVGTQYRSIILYSNEDQRLVIQEIGSAYQALLSDAGYGKLTTVIKPITKFYKAENYHQDYIKKNPNGYCPDHSTGVKFNNKKQMTMPDNTTLAKGKTIVVIEPEGYCPYCEKFKAEVVKNYLGNIPLIFRLASQLEGLRIDSPTWATPTILFLEEGKEVFGHQGYMSPKEFYEALGYFKLGDSEAYRVAFDKGTDAKFCKEYEIFKNTPDGIFLDKLSGAPLFDTRDRFTSSTGWLSFTQPIDGSVYTKPDNSYGMRRTEIRSATSDIHLGHVFPDGPNGSSRYCINATVLDFKQRL
ncbi:MAG: peptide methionine sulfoxide reductase [SAR86 cluster bacterium BACL1 MAG-120920-bin57]|mgnify:FL=1|jgi:peptide methionine sulfoxide reductase msrA/msrB|uniref:Peptide methionine sulfoxide reductase MsrA n=2 Tax=SAR86 cluster TaxID=62672 RepID=A0A0R2UDY0_9GAMM|nr:MAG: peptide methionine sulfoxide reductase [SAR86 cluster bacterium BACL1 MAG-120507-bin14]KRO41101.1 MAG: peptide methionine sulfoxide reductase [SAR86 cluster bacterium BACL1 MAG-120920-bin57]KRO95642.1 MAG: peptide methionine sulfoxide reductase [SAR86 cluster bacterium BACL1 MAG-120820-bin45]KRO97778.1 MAG: peptide methionine sulfoxide reductase [SAR86 cluster bacterium BACL1 MAG-120823-bin87]KRP00003.1 MAG: peptide methionine sulfoxide reductase [SAR86 cluster bacterium BACL1 MAG-12081